MSSIAVATCCASSSARTASTSPAETAGTGQDRSPARPVATTSPPSGATDTHTGPSGGPARSRSPAAVTSPPASHAGIDTSPHGRLCPSSASRRAGGAGRESEVCTGRGPAPGAPLIRSASTSLMPSDSVRDHRGRPASPSSAANSTTRCATVRAVV